MLDTQLSPISNFIWGVADNYLGDLYVRGKYRDVILPMTVLRRLDAVLEPTKEKVLEEKKWLDEADIQDQAAVLQQAADQAFFNTSKFQLKDLTSRDTVELMAQLVFQPVRDRIESGTYLLHDGAIGTGGMLTIAEQTLQDIAMDKDKQISTHLYGQENQQRDLRDLQGRHAPEGRAEHRREHQRRAPALHPVQRRLPVPDLRLHAEQSRLREELGDRPRENGRQERLQGPPVPDQPAPATPSTPWSRGPATAKAYMEDREFWESPNKEMFRATYQDGH